MKSSIRKTTFQIIYNLLDSVSPISEDCGLLCGAACCLCTDEDMGIYLLPGEEKMFTRKEDWLSWDWLDTDKYEFPESWHGKVPFLICKAHGHCPRNERPIQCRTFPLAPHIDDEGTLYLIYQRGQLPYSCPLIDEKIKLNEDFIKATYKAWSMLISEPLIRDLVLMDSEYRIEDKVNIDIVYPV